MELIVDCRITYSSLQSILRIITLRHAYETSLSQTALAKLKPHLRQKMSWYLNSLRLDHPLSNSDFTTRAEVRYAIRV
jgi:hypothetical protein